MKQVLLSHFIGDCMRFREVMELLQGHSANKEQILVERNFPAPTVQSKPGASGLLLGGEEFYGRKARSHGLHI